MNPINDIPSDPIALTAADWWTRLRDPHAAADTVDRWLAWTQADPRHLAAFEQINAMADGAAALPADARRDLAREFAPVGARAWRQPLWFAAAAMLLLALGAGFLAIRRATPARPLVYTTAVAQNRDIVLPDDTRVALGGASTLNVYFSGAERRVEFVSGEAFFRIAHDPQRPFVVDAAGLSARDIGTAFDVRRTGERVSVAVTQGRVRIAGPGAAAQALEARAGQRVSWDPATRALRIREVAPDQATAWQRGALEFVDEPLGVVVANVNRYSARSLRIDGPALARLSFTGTVRADAIGPWLQALPEVFPLRVDESGGAIVLSAR